MAILIDPPRWPAHGTAWSHLVSDASLDELHAFARRIGIPRRGFDLDHYDAPASLYDTIVAMGAEPVSGAELVRRLAGSGLRVRTVDRPAASVRQREAFLRAEWMRLASPACVDADAPWRALGDDLLARWGEPHRRYHDLVHLHDVLLALDQLEVWRGEATDPATLLAAWFHDAVYDGEPGADERRSAALARRSLESAGAPIELADRAAALVLATEPGASVPADPAADALLDADLAILAAGRKRYRAYTTAVRAEYAHVPDAEFRRGRAQVLEAFARRDHLYRTSTGRERWERAARANLAHEISELRGA